MGVGTSKCSSTRLIQGVKNNAFELLLRARSNTPSANQDACFVVRGARTNASELEPINDRRWHHWLRSNFTPPVSPFSARLTLHHPFRNNARAQKKSFKGALDRKGKPEIVLIFFFFLAIFTLKVSFFSLTCVSFYTPSLFQGCRRPARTALLLGL